MECKDCERCPTCEFMIDATTVVEHGQTHYIKGEGCPKDWCDKKVEDMTEEQCREAVKELRGKLLTESKSVEENMAQTGLWENPSKAHKEIMDNPTAYKPMYKKPPLGVKPAFVSSQERIIELSEAITRQAKDTCNGYLIKRWATEILYQCEIMTKC